MREKWFAVLGVSLLMWHQTAFAQVAPAPGSYQPPQVVPIIQPPHPMHQPAYGYSPWVQQQPIVQPPAGGPDIQANPYPGAPFQYMMNPAGPPQGVLTQAGSEGAAPRGGQGGQAGGEGGGEQNNGTNPAQNARAVILFNEFYRLAGGNEINTTYLRLKFPMLGNRGGFTAEAPYKFYSLTNPIAGEVGGLGDVKFQFSYNALISEDKKFTVVTMVEFFIPSADNILLTRTPDANQFTALDVGSGKYVLGPGVAVVYAPAPNFIIAPLYFYEGSVAGDDNRPDIRRGKFRFFMMYALPSGLYALPEFQLVSNFKTGNQDAYFAPEVGYSTKGSTFYFKPGIGINPDPNDREWGIELGVRVIF